VRSELDKTPFVDSQVMFAPDTRKEIILFIIGRAGNGLISYFTVLEIGFYIIIIASAGILFLGLTLKDYSNISSSASVSKENKFCVNCGKEYSTESAGSFCKECGSRL